MVPGDAGAVRRPRLALSLSSLTLALGCAAPPPPDAGDTGGMDAAEDAVCPAPRLLDGAICCPVLGKSSGTGAELFVGTGNDGTFDGFRRLAPGDPLGATLGEQGLQHIVVALRGRGFDPRPLVRVRIVRADDCEEIGRLQIRLPFRAPPDDAGQLALPALRVPLIDDRDPNEYCTVLGRDAIIVVDLDDQGGHSAHREAQIHVPGIDPAVRPDVREAWIRNCSRRDGGGPDGG